MENILGMKWTVSGGMAKKDILMRSLYEFQNNYNFQKPLFDSVHDCHGMLTWQGGRLPIYDTNSLQNYALLAYSYKLNDVDFNIIFNNPLIEEKHLEDEYCNYFLENMYQKGNGVIISSDILYDYIKSNYPDYKLIYSCINGTGCTQDEYKDFIKSKIPEYDLVVFDPNFNHNYEFIKELDVNKLEILVNQPCIKHCDYTKKHYMRFAECALNREYIFKTNKEIPICIHKRNVDINNDISKILQNEMFLSFDQIDKLRELGITHFKLCGRDQPDNEFVVQFNNYIINYMMQRMCNDYENIKNLI